MSDETLMRLEYKLDLIISYLQTHGVGEKMMKDLPPMVGIEQDQCPVCQEPIKVVANFAAESLTRQCGCSSPIKIVPGISQLTKPPEVKNGNRSGKSESSVSSDEAESGSGGSRR